MEPEPTQAFSQEEILRYSRHILIPEFRIQGQHLLKNSRVLVVGAGGLGSPVLLYLAAAGIGQIGIVDGDRVDDTNLQRQVLFDTTKVGLGKARQAAERIRLLNPHIEVTTYDTWINSKNALDIIEPYDLVVDGTDNFPTRYLINDACVILAKTLIYGSIFQFEGQVSVFNQALPSGDRGPNYRDLFPEPPPPGLVPSCAEGGVLGVLPGIIGSMQANEAIKVLTGIGTTLSGRLFIFDALHFESTTLKISRNTSLPPIEKLIDYEEFCGLNQDSNLSDINEITPVDFEAYKNSGEPYQLIDVREAYEYDIVDLGGEKIPLNQIEGATGGIKLDRKVILYCRTGKRSGDAIRRIQQKGSFTNLYNLSGGILAYIEMVDPTLTKY